MRARFRMSGRNQVADVVRENSKTIVIPARKRGENKYVKRHKVKHDVQLLPGRSDLDIDLEPKKRMDIEI